MIYHFCLFSLEFISLKYGMHVAGDFFFLLEKELNWNAKLTKLYFSKSQNISIF